MLRIVSALILAGLPARPAVAASCTVDFVGKHHVVLSGTTAGTRLCAVTPGDPPSLRCANIPSSQEVSRVVRVPDGADRVYARVGAGDLRATVGMLPPTCATSKQATPGVLANGDVVAALITMAGTNLILLIAFLGRAWLDERRAYGDWLAASRRHLKTGSGARREDFLPPEDDRYLRAGAKAKRLRSAIIDAVERSFAEHGASGSNALVVSDATALRVKLVQML